jgi:RNAse (barnase) inhibitor barstar
MGRLLQRLEDPARSGVYRAARADEIVEATRGTALKVVRIAGSKKIDLLENIAEALAFPEWFGRNWDALEDCLTDLSWNQAAGYVLIFENARSNDVMTDILASAAEFWRGRGKPFFAVFIDPARKMPLPDLFREA